MSIRIYLLIAVFTSAFFCFNSAYSGTLKSLDIGKTAKGDTQEENGKFTVMGNGGDIWGTEDQFRFVYTEVKGDFDAVVHLVSFQKIEDWTKSGLMARQTVDADSANVLSTITGGGASGCQLTWRPSKGAESFEFFDAAPGQWWETGGWLKLVRKGDDFEGFISKDGKDWLSLESTTVAMSDPILVGMAVTSKSDGVLAKTVFENFTITQNGKQIFPLAVEKEGRLITTWSTIKNSEWIEE